MAIIRRTEMEIISKSAQMTVDIGCRLGKILGPDSVIALNGDLAAGKTMLTKGIGQALNIKEVINSAAVFI